MSGVYYNKKLFEKAGVKAEDIKSWDDFLGAVKKLKAAGITPLVVGAGEKWPMHFYYSYLVMRIGGEHALADAKAGKDGGFKNATFVEAGKRLHELAGWHKPIPESMPQYQLGAPAFRVASMPPTEVRLGLPRRSRAASCHGGTISAPCMRTGANIRPPSRSSPGTRRTRMCSWIGSRRPMSAWCGRRATTTSMARTRPTTAPCIPIAAC